MRELVVLSGKGGTGKTTLSAAFAALAKNSLLCDADVDAADLHLLMQPEIRYREDFIGGSKAIIQPSLCTGCGTCIELCRFEAISDRFEVDAIRCEGCGVCVDFCPEGAVDFPGQRCGEWYVSDTRFGPMVHAQLGIGEENSGKLVSLIRNKSREMAVARECGLIITDGPPGTGCPVIASLGGATAMVIIAEPSVSGLHDMARLVDLADFFKVPGMVCINKFDLNREMTGTIERLAAKRNVELLGRVRFDPAFTHAMVRGKNILEYGGGSEAGAEVTAVWEKILNSRYMRSPGIRDLRAINQ
jgi:MinD superfamily P-loop ATPase